MFCKSENIISLKRVVKMARDYIECSNPLKRYALAQAIVLACEDLATTTKVAGKPLTPFDLFYYLKELESIINNPDAFYSRKI